MNVAQHHDLKNIIRTANYYTFRAEQYYQQNPISWLIDALRSGMKGEHNSTFS